MNVTRRRCKNWESAMKVSLLLAPGGGANWESEMNHSFLLAPGGAAKIEKVTLMRPFHGNL